MTATAKELPKKRTTTLVARRVVAGSKVRLLMFSIVRKTTNTLKRFIRGGRSRNFENATSFRQEKAKSPT